ncbi:MAG TPA: hypothetical protein VI279_13190, partial [Rhodocyclaceae bacterium]
MALPAPAPDNFIDRLRNAGIRPDDGEELRMAKSLLVFATGLVTIGSMLWLCVYWLLGPQLSSTYPFAFQLLLALNLFIYAKTGNFDFFRIS